MTRRAAGALLICFVILAVAAAGIAYWLRPKPPPHLTLAAATYGKLIAWQNDRVARALPALLRSCAALLARPADAVLDPRTKSADFGSPGDWRDLCAGAAKLRAGDDDAARHFFETETIPLLAGSDGDPDGLFTGYFEITLRGSRQRTGPYQTPLYRRPPDPKRTAYARAEIDGGALAGQGLELVWVDDPVDAFFLEIQGSGLVRLREGGTMRVGFDGQNGKPYVAVGRLLADRGDMPREQVTMAAIRGWMKAHPKEGAALREENPSYVFFREVPGDGPLGAERVVLSPGRSLAVDRNFIPLGVPLWLEATQRYTGETMHRLLVAQDTGGAIKGPVRGDLFWGHGRIAADGAGAMSARGRYYLLLPKPIAARLAPSM